jgi:type II secretory pathway pseudopilin PulG
MIRFSPRLRTKAFTLTEALVVVGLMSLVTVPVLYTFQFILRTQATAANQSMVRLDTNKAINQLIFDLRNTSRGMYNEIADNKLKVTSGAGTPNLSYQITILDTVTGQRIRWSYDAVSQQLTRRSEDFSTSATPVISETTFRTRFADFRLEETLRDDIPTETAGGGTVDETITGIRISGRSFLSLRPYHTTFREVDANNDGDFRNDKVGAELFGRDDLGDDPRWQYIFNVQMTFRNT